MTCEIIQLCLAALQLPVQVDVSRVVAPEGDAVDEGETEMDEGVEDDVGDEEVDRLCRQLGLVQVHSQEDGGQPNSQGRVADEPVGPVEQGPHRVPRVGPDMIGFCFWTHLAP